MMIRGEKDNHFRILTKKEAETTLAGPPCFSYQTTAFRDSSQSTKVRHISNPSNVGAHSGSSLNMEQKVSGNLSNPPELSLCAFTMYAHPLSSDISSAYCKIGVDPEHRWFQLLCLYDFSKPDWELHPLVCEQMGLPFGSSQSGNFLELILEKQLKAQR